MTHTASAHTTHEDRRRAQVIDDTSLAALPAPRRQSTRFFVRHFLEMVAAMLVGMAVLGPVAGLLFAQWGRADLTEDPVISAIVMATTMTIGMTVWMRYRRHSWVSTAEMGAAMYLPFAVFFVPFWVGAISGDVVMMAGHILMLPAMVLVMIRRRDEYSTDHRRPSR